MEKTSTFFWVLVILLAGSLPLAAQPIEVIDGNTAPYTPENLITNIFLGQGVEVTNVQHFGNPAAVGFFKDAIDEIGIDRGLIMTSGSAATSGFALGADNPGSSFASTSNASFPVSDPDIQDLTINPPQDVCKYVISFIPISDTLEFRYVWASEEYPEYSCSPFTDAFGFFISGPGINGPFENNGINIALIPGTASQVSIGTIHPQNGPGCAPLNDQYYNNNNGMPTEPVYDGFLDVFTAQVVVVPCQEYTIKLIVADGSDNIFDSAVFLEAKSFGTGILDVEVNTASPDETLTEGCSDGTLVFSLGGPVESDYMVEYTLFGTATNGVDLTEIPDTIIIPAGDSTISIPLTAFEDGLVEGTEFIGLDVQRDACNRDTFYIYVRDNELIPPDLGPDQFICASEEVQLDGTLNIPLPPPPSFSNTNDVPISPTFTNIFSPINVFSVQPFDLGPNVIQSVCVNIDHNWLSDVDMYLVGPNGQFVELATDVGSNGDDFINTCFEPNAVPLINYINPPATGAPYTGTFGAEGVWSDLWSSASNPTNGEWNLLLIDDANGFAGTLLDWTITFEPLYQIYYSWSPITGLSCADCPDPIASPDTTTTYVLTAYDSYGCEVTDTITFFVDDVLPAPIVECTSVTDSCITISWPLIPGALDYEVNIDGAGWIPVNGPLSHTVCGLTFNQTLVFEVRAIDDCDGLIGTATCITPDCDGADPVVDFVTNVSCNGGSNGSIQVSATGAFPPFEFTLNGVTNTTGLFTDLPAEDYTITVNNSAGCPVAVAVAVDEPNAMVANPITISPITCFNANDGAVTVSVTGGTGPYNFQWGNGQTDSIAINVAPGPISVEVTDQNGCSVISSVTLSNPTELTLDTSFSPVICFGDTTGSASVFASGGAPDYTYLWDANAGSQATPTAIDLGGGTYSVTVTDANGCEEVASVTVTENTDIVLSTSTTNASCEGFTDGSATVNAVGGGIGIYTFQWDANAGNQITQTAVGLGVGSYSVTVSDLFGCSDSITVGVVAPNDIMASLTVDSVSCSYLDDGSAIVVASGGTPGYTYAWSDGGAPIDTRTDLGAGPQTVTVTDANGCFEVAPFIVPSPPELTVSLTTSPVSCFDGADGTATATPAGGTGTNYGFTWEDGQSLATATSLEAGAIGVTVSDINGCLAVGSIEVVEPEELTLALSSVPSGCFGAPGGTATAVVDGGVGGYIYEWSNAQGTPTATSLLAGNYSVTVFDGNNCSVSGTIAVGEAPELTSITSGTNVSCNGTPDGTATVIPSGGTPGYEFIWSTGDITPVVGSLPAGTYTVTITDLNGCTTTNTVTLTSPTDITFNFSSENIDCNGGDNGTASVQILTGTPPYTVIWSNGQSGQTIAGLTAGAYGVTITDANDCEATGSINLTEPGPLSATLIQTGALCNNAPSGSASVSGIFYGNIPANLSAFTYAWSTIPVQINPTANNLVGGQTYSVTITDANGCELVQSISIDNPPPVELVVLSTANVSCFDGADGSATVQASGGTGPYTYQWDAGAGLQIDPTAANLPAGTFNVTATDANGCEATTKATIGQPTQVELTLSPDPVECFGEATGAVEAEVSGGTPPYTVVWSTGQTGLLLDILPAGQYTATVVDANGCEMTRTATVTQPEAPITSVYGTIDPSCFNYTDGIIQMTASGGLAPYSYSLDGETFVGSPNILGLGAGSYFVTIRDDNGCEYISDEITILDPPPFGVDLGADLEIEQGLQAQLSAILTNASGPVTYEWIPVTPTGLTCYDCPQPLTDPLAFPATFQLVVTDSAGCIAEDLIRILVDIERRVLVPTGFSPNGDGENDLLMVHGIEGTQVKLFRVFDRWGELVYEASDFQVNDPLIGWDGRFRGQLMNSGVFIWYLEVEYADGVEEAFKGNTTLIR